VLDCAVVGDSIADMVAPYFHECSINAHIGDTSIKIVGRMRDADLVVLSAGSNDYDNPSLERNLRMIRKKSLHKVIWILPINPRAASIVERVALDYKDSVVRFSPGHDNVHPKDPKALANVIRQYFP
jgi:hypothetical protein